MRLNGILPKSPKARRVLAIFIVLALAVAAYIFFTRKPRDSREFELAQNAARLRQIEALKRDSDADGLRDWEEAIFHTDPQTADTDADGTADGEEVRQARDPLKPNTAKNLADPNDMAATSTPLAAVLQADAPDTTNLTQIIAQSLGQQLIARRLTDPEAQIDPEAIGRSIAQGLPTYTPETPILTLKDITVTQDNSDAAVKEWAQRSDAALTESFRGNDQFEALIAVNALKDENYDALARLDAYLQGYDAAVTKTKKIPVPAALAQDELDFLRNIMKLRDTVSRFRNAEKDPVTALAALNPYFILVQKIRDWNKKMQQEFSRRHITFQQ